MRVPFEFEGLLVRVATAAGGEHWFCAKDISTVIGYSNISQTIGDHNRHHHSRNKYVSLTLKRLPCGSRI
ncbi:BRO family protein [Pseudomonas sp. 2hn]|uniref:BRO family protein n=1 Tax=Pseudomonas sp. 2hn TaxID=2866626 RepID=UPI00217EE7FC|nr:BRO family protein [Pseudomonas sp. 2hn]